MFRRVSPTDRDRPAWHNASVLTIGTLLALRTYELGFHGWDVRASVDPAAEVRPELCPFLVDLVRRLFVLGACRPDANLEGTSRFEVDGLNWTNRVVGGRVEGASPSAVPDAIIPDGPEHVSAPRDLAPSLGRSRGSGLDGRRASAGRAAVWRHLFPYFA